MDAASSQVAAAIDHHDDYALFLAALEERVAAVEGPLFTTTATDLPATFLDHLPAEKRQVYSCAQCNQFLERFGGLVTVDTHGGLHSVFWNGGLPPFYQRAADAIRQRLTSATIRAVFIQKDNVWGKACTGPWRHMAIASVPARLLRQHALLNSSQIAAEKKADLEILTRSLDEFSPSAVDQALSLLRRETLYRSEKVLGVAQWLHDLQEATRDVRGKARTHLLWKAVGAAPAGFCHVRSTMIGTLLEDICAGLPFDQVSRRFAEKMHPLQYQRPTAAPAAGNIARAEKIIAELKSAGSLERRFAKLSDIQTLWIPGLAATANRPSPGVFDHLKHMAKKVTAVEAPAVTMTWDKFRRTVLPEARTIDLYTPARREAYSALVTAADPAAPNIMQWSNPISCYMRVNGSLPAEWNLANDSWHELTAITLAPWMWDTSPGSHHSHQGERVFLLVKGARDTIYSTGAGFFPEFLKGEYREIRATIEAYVKAATVQGAKEAEACGLCLSKGATWSTRIRVNGTDLYTLDRWD